MTDHKGHTVLVIDNKLFTEFAVRLARDFGTVFYHSPSETGFSHVNDAVVGGLDNVIRCDDIHSVFDEVDLFAFPDSQNSWLQLLLERMGKRVWGSRRGQKLEQDRIFFRHLQEDIGMPVPGYKVCKGIDALKDYLRDNDDKYVKISRFRGYMETWHHVNYALSEQKLLSLELAAGAVKDQITFLVDDPIVTDLEDGWDGYCVDGQFPDTAVQGIEIKDKSYLGSVLPYKEMPKELTVCNQALADALKEVRYRNLFSTEVRIKDGVSYLTDPCCRQASPAGECLLELIDNFSDVVWFGAEGELVQPEFGAKFAAEAMIYHDGDPEHWRAIEVPEKVRRWVKLYRACQPDDLYQIVPSQPHIEEIGAVVGLGDTIEEAVEAVKEHVGWLGEQHISVKTKSLYEALEEIHKAEKQGIEFTGQTVPSPDIALQDA